MFRRRGKAGEVHKPEHPEPICGLPLLFAGVYVIMIQKYRIAEEKLWLRKLLKKQKSDQMVLKGL